MWGVKKVSKSKNYFSPMLICWNDIKIHLGFEDSYFVPPPTYSSSFFNAGVEQFIDNVSSPVLLKDFTWIMVNNIKS